VIWEVLVKVKVKVKVKVRELRLFDSVRFSPASPQL
jgi:hypothetical protein